MEIETRIVKKGETFNFKNGKEFTPSTDLYFVIDMRLIEYFFYAIILPIWQ